MTTPTQSSSFADALGSRMHFLEQGDGTPIVHLHGNPTSSFLWRNILPASALHGRAIAPDMIGFGRSDKPDIAYRFHDHVRYFDAFMDALGLDGVVLVLHDWGGGVGLSWARRHADRVRGVVVTEAVVKPISWSAASLRERLVFRAMRHPRIGDWLNLRNAFFVRVLMQQMTSTRLDAEVRAAYMEPFPTRASRVPVAQWPREIAFDGDPADVHIEVERNYRWFKEADVPKLLLHAQPGVIFKPDEVAKIAEGARELTIRSIGEGLHFVQEDAPDAINRELAQWLPTVTG